MGIKRVKKGWKETGGGFLGNISDKELEALKVIWEDYRATDKKKEKEKLKEKALKIVEKNTPKIESSYSFSALKKDLTVFAGKGIDSVLADPNIKKEMLGFAKNDKAKAKYFSGEFPEEILTAIDERTQALLQGFGDFVGVDAATTSQISTLIAVNAAKSVVEIRDILQENFPFMTMNRAELIASTEVSNAVEGTRDAMYDVAFGDDSEMKWNDVGDDHVRPAHEKNAAQGWIPADAEFASGEKHPGEAVRCRCTKVRRPK